MISCLEVQNIVKTYNGINAVNGLTFSAHVGQILSILGPNGAGKTTLIKMITTIIKPDSGTARIFGKDVVTQKSDIPYLVAVSPQETVIYNELTARENLVFFASLYGIKYKDALNLANNTLKQLGLGNRYDKVKNYSGGMKRRLNIAISVIANPRILILDEPTVGLDPQSKNAVWEFIKALKNDGKTIILTTHDMMEADLLSDRVIIMDQGKIIADGTPQSLKTQFGQGNILEMHFNDISQIEPITDELKKIEFVKKIISGKDHTITIHISGNMINLAHVLTHSLIKDLNNIDSINIRQTSLEDVFLELTGRRLRE